jgi:hypothetical protein
LKKVDPELVTYGRNGETVSVHYEQIDSMLLNEFLKEHRKVQELQAPVNQQQDSFRSRLAEQQRQIEALTIGLHEVSAEGDLSKERPQSALNGR